MITLNNERLEAIQNGTKTALLQGCRHVDSATDLNGDIFNIGNMDADRVSITELMSFGRVWKVGDEIKIVNALQQDTEHCTTVAELEVVHYNTIIEADAVALGYADLAAFRRDKRREIDFMRGFLIWLE